MQLYSFANQVLPHLNDLYGRKNIADVNRYNEVMKDFTKCFRSREMYLASAPGRVELIGNHTDHNGGKVIACTVNLDIIAAFAPVEGERIRILSRTRPGLYFNVSDSGPCSRNVGLLKGVVHYLAEQGYKVGGFDAISHSAVPAGAGVSSSAAFEMLVGTILSYLYNDGAIPVETIARAGQYAETVYFHKPCGLLDPAVIGVGGAVLLDFADGMRYQRLDTDLGGLSLILINTGANHSHLTSRYAMIPAEMKTVAKDFGKERLIEVDPQQFFAAFNDEKKAHGIRPALRARHFFNEQVRVEQMAELLSAPDPDPERIMQLINASGESSFNDLQNCTGFAGDTSISQILDFAHSVCHCAARVHGGGFAGTVLCVVPPEHTARFVDAARAAYGAARVFPLQLRNQGVVVL